MSHLITCINLFDAFLSQLLWMPGASSGCLLEPVDSNPSRPRSLAGAENPLHPSLPSTRPFSPFFFFSTVFLLLLLDFSLFPTSSLFPLHPCGRSKLPSSPGLRLPYCRGQPGEAGMSLESRSQRKGADRPSWRLELPWDQPITC